MPHRADYFVLAYSWDHHCGVLVESLKRRFEHVAAEVSGLERDELTGTEALLAYYKKWHYNNELYHLAMTELTSRQFVINSLGYRGYGVNRDLLKALGDLKERYRGLEASLIGGFYRKARLANQTVSLDGDTIDQRRSDRIIAKLAGKIGKNAADEIPRARKEDPFDLDHYFTVMSKETSWDVNTTIFRKMFFSVGSSSMTIMKGSTGLHNGLSCQELKLLANRNFVETGREIFSTLPAFTQIGIDVVKRIHLALSRGLDPHAGAFRKIDFPDRNGVTFEFGNFHREVSDLAMVLDQTGRSFHHLDEFVYNLARSYYMFIGIHPFWDANGRAGKCFVNSLFLKKGLPPVVLDDEEEVLALPRYGGSMEDMHAYLKRRLRRATETYFYERSKMEALGLFGKIVHNVGFDSAFHFRQIDGRTQKIEVGFEAYVCGDTHVLEVLMDQCRIAFSDARLLYGMTVHCGFCDGPFTEWRYPFSMKGNLHIKEVTPEIAGVRAFDVDFILDIPRQVKRGDYFSCSIASPEAGLVFTNKGLNYSYRLEL